MNSRHDFRLPDADVALWPQWLDTAEADALFAELRQAIAWETHRIRLFGRELDSPRLSCWIGDPGAAYTYSRSRFEPRPWPSALAAVRERVEQDCGTHFNSVLANLYRDGRDSMGWHSDNEPELGPAPTIFSFSFGGVRRFRLRHRRDPRQRLELDLPSGSLLRMAGTTQRFYRHDLPKTARAVAARINLTYRLWAPA